MKPLKILRRSEANQQYLAGYLPDFGVQVERKCEHVETGSVVGIDMGLKFFYTDSDGNTIENQRHYRKAETKLKRLHRRVSRKQKKGKNRKKARQRLAKASRDACNGSVKISLAKPRTRSSRLTSFFAVRRVGAC